MVSRIYNFEEINLRTVMIGVRSNMGVFMSAGGHADCRSCKKYIHQENQPEQQYDDEDKENVSRHEKGVLYRGAHIKAKNTI